MDSEVRICLGCGETLPAEKFASGTRSRRCRPCVAAYSKERYARTRERRLEWERWKHLQDTYGMGRNAYERLLAGQRGRCAICHTDSPGGRGNRFHVDHDHTCCPGKKSCGACVRALLCMHCNQGLGNFRDDAGRLTAAAAYLYKHLTPPAQ